MTATHMHGQFPQRRRCSSMIPNPVWGHNTKYAASPSYDLNGELYDYELGNAGAEFP